MMQVEGDIKVRLIEKVAGALETTRRALLARMTPRARKTIGRAVAMDPRTGAAVQRSMASRKRAVKKALKGKPMSTAAKAATGVAALGVGGYGYHEAKKTREAGRKKKAEIKKGGMA
ncbi:MAG: hypothetical protein V3W37_08595 [Candidatus Binatia bacterium]